MDKSVGNCARTVTLAPSVCVGAVTVTRTVPVPQLECRTIGTGCRCASHVTRNFRLFAMGALETQKIRSFPELRAILRI